MAKPKSRDKSCPRRGYGKSVDDIGAPKFEISHTKVLSTTLFWQHVNKGNVECYVWRAPTEKGGLPTGGCALWPRGGEAAMMGLGLSIALFDLGSC